MVFKESDEGDFLMLPQHNTLGGGRELNTFRTGENAMNCKEMWFWLSSFRSSVNSYSFLLTHKIETQDLLFEFEPNNKF